MKKVAAGIAILLVSVGLYLLWGRHVFDNFTVERIEKFVAGFGSFAPLAYIVLLAVSIIVSQIPNIPLAVASGMLFGTFWGGLYSIIGGMLGAVACFSIARSLGIVFIKKIIGEIPCFTEKCKEKHLVLLVFLSRLVPFFSFDLVSYCAGLTNIKARTFMIATFLGMIPMTFLFTHMGEEVRIHTSVSLILNGIALIVFLVLPLMVKKYNIFGLNEYIEFR
jgi:uncharacterized membrane protein YdjX (TVP38/TMEM64 family)